ncbi:MAG: hypothetical protein ACE5NA_05795 [Nitrospiraceae bacterium]
MGLDSHLFADFRSRVKQTKGNSQEAWEASARLVTRSSLHSTLTRLAEAIKGSGLPLPLCQALLRGIADGQADRIQDLPAPLLKDLTGMAPTKAVRLLCLEFGLITSENPTASSPWAEPARVEDLVRARSNPYDLLLEPDLPSLLDVGAGDLSFASEVVERYLPLMVQQDRTLTLHCIDRLKPGSGLGGMLHADQARLDRLRHSASPALRFRFWGDLDMFQLHAVKKALPKYTVVTCHAPATPAFAYEPTRVAPSIIEGHLRRTKGEYRIVRSGGEEALEVRDGGRTLLFPPWKFEVRGPLALLDLVSQRGTLCVLQAVDTEVFWELLAQLVADPKVRPPDVVFTPGVVAEHFGSVYRRLSELSHGEPIDLATVAELRQEVPSVLGQSDNEKRSYRFRYVEVRRGALFEGVPASQTARLFSQMKEETPPWMLVLVPDRSEIV